MDNLDWTAFVTPSIGATGLLALVVIMILRGSLVPRATMDSRISDKDAQISMWQKAYETSQAAGELKDQHIAALLEATKTTTSVVTAVSEVAGLNSGRSRHAVAPTQDD